MPRKRKAEQPAWVFLNCPFDEAYEETLRALVFVIAQCGYRPACALEDDDSGRIRFEKLKALISQSDLSIHDLSRTQVSIETGVPRFNMPFELGLYLGALHFGGRRQRVKRALVLAAQRDHWAPALSDLAGVDPVFHRNQPRAVIRAVRDFLHRRPDGGILPGEDALIRMYERFRKDLRQLAIDSQLTEAEALRYKNYLSFVTTFLATPR